MFIFLLQLRHMLGGYPEIYLFAFYSVLIWALWIIKVLLSRRYRPYTEPHRASTSVIVPVVDEPLDLFRDVLKVRGDFAGRGHHLFNELGILLRKCGLLDLATSAFARALEIVTDDENLYYNLARAHYENDDWDGCMTNLIESHRLNPGLPVARDLLGLVVGLHEDPSLLKRYGKPPVPESTASRAKDLLQVDTDKLTLDESPIAPIERGHVRFGGKGVVTFKRHGKKK